SELLTKKKKQKESFNNNNNSFILVEANLKVSLCIYNECYADFCRNMESRPLRSTLRQAQTDNPPF
ncbi:hypothetical protein, partial [Mucilaginibacter lappiensis]